MPLTIFYSFFFFKQKTAYEITVRDWSSDVCSSDLAASAASTGEVPARYERVSGGGPVRGESCALPTRILPAPSRDLPLRGRRLRAQRGRARSPDARPDPGLHPPDGAHGTDRQPGVRGLGRSLRDSDGDR